MLLTLITLAIAPLPARPMFADYVLNVPIRIENMRNLTSVNLSCDIYHIGTAATDKQSLGTPGTGQASVPVSGGNYTGTVTVTVAVSAANAIRYTPNTWSCDLVYQWRNPDGSEFRESVGTDADRAAAYTRLTGQEISTYTTHITGPLPGA